MIVVKVEVWPHGQQASAREIGRVFVTNTLDEGNESDYHVLAEEYGARHLDIAGTIEEFELFGHNRKQSVFSLLGKVFGILRRRVEKNS